MLKNYLLVAIRTLFRNKSYTLINIVGLALGIAGVLFIYLYIDNEKAVDKRFAKKNLIRITSEWFQDNKFLEHRAAAVPALEQLFASDYPEVKSYARYHKAAQNIVRITSEYGELKFEENDIFYADPDFLDLFDISFVKGNPDKALMGPNKVVVTEAIAKKYFGSLDAIGQTLKFNGEFEFICQVSGVVKDFKSDSHLAGNMVISLETKVAMVPFEIYNNWTW